MEKIVLKKDGRKYTYMLDIINSLGGNNLNCNWLITDIEAYPMDKDINSIIYDQNYVILSNNELINMLEKENFQWIWAIFSMIPKKYSKKDILKYKLPSIKNISLNGDNSLNIQHKLASLEIDCIDSSYCQIIK